MNDLLIPEDPPCLSQWVVEITVPDEDEGPGEEIGSLHIVRAELDTPDLFNELDAAGDDLADIGAAVLDVTTGSLREDIAELLESWEPYFLILHTAVLAHRWRGYDLGPLIAGTALEKLDVGCAFAAVVPAPLTGKARGPARAVAVEKIGRVWGFLGSRRSSPGATCGSSTSA